MWHDSSSREYDYSQDELDQDWLDAQELRREEQNDESRREQCQIREN